MKETLSIRLLQTLTAAKGQLSAEALALIRQYVDGQRVEREVSFKNKAGEADVYYTAFGWLLCYVLDITLDSKQRKAYLAGIQDAELGLIHYAALMRCRLLDELMDKGKLLMAFTGGKKRDIPALSSFHEVPQGDLNNPYTQFIWQGLLEDTGHTANAYDASRLEAYHLPKRGYANSPAHDVAYLNATVAALALKGSAEGWKAGDDVEALRHMQEESGGFKASDAAPIADLLSTATALFVLKQYKAKPLYDASDFITSHWLENGGFGATLIDVESDVEYVFYGLLALGAL